MIPSSTVPRFHALFPAFDGTRQQAPHRSLTYARDRGDLTIGKTLCAQREQQPVARRQLAHDGARAPPIRSVIRRFDNAQVELLAPGQPPHAPPPPIAAGIDGYFEEPRPKVRAVAVTLEMLQQLEKRLLDDVIGVIGAPECE